MIGLQQVLERYDFFKVQTTCTKKGITIQQGLHTMQKQQSQIFLIMSFRQSEDLWQYLSYPMKIWRQIFLPHQKVTKHIRSPHRLTHPWYPD